MGFSYRSANYVNLLRPPNYPRISFSGPEFDVSRIPQGHGKEQCVVVLDLLARQYALTRRVPGEYSVLVRKQPWDYLESSGGLGFSGQKPAAAQREEKS